MLQVIGAGVDSVTQTQLVFMYPLAAQQPEVLQWAVSNLAAPNAITLCRRAVNLVDVTDAENYVLKVERYRVRDVSKVTEPWAVAAVAEVACALVAVEPAPEEVADDEADEDEPDPADGAEPPKPGAKAVKTARPEKRCEAESWRPRSHYG